MTEIGQPPFTGIKNRDSKWSFGDRGKRKMRFRKGQQGHIFSRALIQLGNYLSFQLLKIIIIQIHIYIYIYISFNKDEESDVKKNETYFKLCVIRICIAYNAESK